MAEEPTFSRRNINYAVNQKAKKNNKVLFHIFVKFHENLETHRQIVTIIGRFHVAGRFHFNFFFFLLFLNWGTMS